MITGWGPELSSEALGYPVTAFLTLEIRQGAGHESVAQHLAQIPEVLEAFTITGAGDMWCRVVARSNNDLQRVIDAVLANPGIVRSSTVIALATQVPYRILPLADRPDSPSRKAPSWRAKVEPIVTDYQVEVRARATASAASATLGPMRRRRARRG